MVKKNEKGQIIQDWGKSTSRTQDQIKKELESADKQVVEAREQYGYLNKRAKDIRAQIKALKETYHMYNLMGKKVPNESHKPTKAAMDKVKQLEAQLKDVNDLKKYYGKVLANKKYYVNRLNNELTLPFKSAKEQAKSDSKKANKVKKNLKTNQTKEKPAPQVTLDVITKKEFADYKPQLSGEMKLKVTPTVTLVPHTKKNGMPSKKHSDIQYVDSDGKINVFTKDMLKAAMKSRGASSEQIDYTWNNYVEAARNGTLQPEVVASFFKGEKQQTQTQAQVQQPHVQQAAATKSAEQTGPTAEQWGNMHANNNPFGNKFTITGGIGEQYAPGEVQVEETTVDKLKTRTVIKTPDGVSYSFGNDGSLKVSGSYAGMSQEAGKLIPNYASEKSPKQEFGGVGLHHVYKLDNGNLKCGQSVGKVESAVKMAEQERLLGIVQRNAVYNDLKREEAKRNLTEPEKKFMKSHEDTLQKSGLIRCDDGVLEYKDCPKEFYNTQAHQRASALQVQIKSGTVKSTTTTIREGGNNAQQQQKSAGRE